MATFLEEVLGPVPSAEGLYNSHAYPIEEKLRVDVRFHLDDTRLKAIGRCNLLTKFDHISARLNPAWIPTN